MEINTPCSCGTAKCSGFIGGALKKEEIKKEAKERKKAKAKRRKKKRQSLATPLVKAESELKVLELPDPMEKMLAILDPPLDEEIILN